MKAPIPPENLPTPEETAAVVTRERAVGTGPNWAAVSAGFVCPGAGQFICGEKTTGAAFLIMFFLASLIAFIPLGGMLLKAIDGAVNLNGGGPAPAIPWLALFCGIGLSALVWIAAMIHAAFLRPSASD